MAQSASACIEVQFVVLSPALWRVRSVQSSLIGCGMHFRCGRQRGSSPRIGRAYSVGSRQLGRAFWGWYPQL